MNLQFRIKTFGMLGCILFSLVSFSQRGPLRQGFDADEYADMLWLNFHAIADSLKDVPEFKLEKGTYRREFRSPEVGFKNLCEVYLRQDSTVVLSLRGTVPDPVSWMANLYAGMVPAIGGMQLSDNYRFDYRLAADSGANVHVGWTASTGFLAREYEPVLERLFRRGLRNLIVMGHSQGGALAFLNTSHVHYRMRDAFPDLVIKTYASAAPKPGDLSYAYDFDFITGPGMAYRVVNVEDWVPETPLSVQRLSDFHEANPFVMAPDMIRQQKFPVRQALSYSFKSMRNGSDKAARRYTKYLGKSLGKQAKKALPGFVPPAYSKSSLYMTAGAPIILQPDQEYHNLFPFDNKDFFIHHLYKPYSYLLRRQFPAK